MADYPVEARLWEHEKTGALLVRVDSDDQESFGAFCFPTHPNDSTGVSHILEHTVLCGSKNYPGPATFIQLYRSSLSSFLNAMTYGTATLYPFGSPLEADFKNLLDVYADAVFHPLLREATFLQEGWRLARIDGKLDYTGVVYNEMRGNMAMLVSLAGQKLGESLWTQGPLSHNSGGDPLCIPDLTLDGLRAFHERWYHPSSSVLFLYGKLDDAYYFDRLDSILHPFTRRERPPSYEPQARRSQPIRKEYSYPASPGAKTAVLIGWLAEDRDMLRDSLGLDLVHQMLVGEGGLLRRRLLDEGLAEDLDSLSMRHKEEREGALQFGLLGVPDDLANGVESFVLEALREIVKEGFPKDMVEAELELRAFHFREVRPHQGGGILNKFPEVLLRPELWPTQFSRLDLLKQWKAEWLSGKPVFEELTQKYLLDNLHRSTLIFRPDADYFSHLEVQRRAPLQKMEMNWSSGDENNVAEKHRILEDLQAQPPAVNLPLLAKSDLPRDIVHYPLETETRWERTQSYEAPTNGIVYLDLAWETTGFSRDDYFWLGLLPHALGSLDLEGLPYDLHLRKQKLLFGSIHAQFQVRTKVDGSLLGELTLRVGMIRERLKEGLAYLAFVLGKTDWQGSARVGEWLAEMTHEFHQYVTCYGHSFATSLAGAGLCPAADFSEQAFGLTSFARLSGLLGRPEGSATSAQELRRVWNQLHCRSRLSALWTSDGPGLEAVRGLWTDFLAALPDGVGGSGYPEAVSGSLNRVVFYHLDSSFNAVCLPIQRDWKKSSVYQLVDSHLSLGTLHALVREKGGAYGVCLNTHVLAGVSSFATFRDPRTAASIDDFYRVLGELSRKLVSQKEIDQTLLGVIGNLITPIPPKDRGLFTWSREKTGLTLEMRRTLRQALFDIGPKDLQQACRSLLKAWENRSVVVFSGKEVYRQDPVWGAEETDLNLISPTKE